MTHFLCAVGWHDRRIAEGTVQHSPKEEFVTWGYTCTRCPARWVFYSIRSQLGNGGFFVRLPNGRPYAWWPLPADEAGTDGRE